MKTKILWMLCSFLSAHSSFAKPTQHHFVCNFKELDFEVQASFTIFNLEKNPSLKGEPLNDDYIVSSNVKNAPIFFQYRVSGEKEWTTPENPYYVLNAGAFNESVDLNQIVTPEGKNALLMSTADSENSVSLALTLDQASQYQTGTYQFTSRDDGRDSSVPVTCVVKKINKKGAKLRK